MTFKLGSVMVDFDSDVSGFKKGANEAKKELKSIETVAEKSSSGLINVGKVAEFALGGVVASGLSGIASSAGSFFSEQLNSAKNLESVRMAFNGIIGEAKAGDIMKQIVKEAAATPFEIPQLAESGKMLAAFGVKAEDIIPSIRRVGDVAAGLDIPIEELAGIIGKMQSSGRAMTDDINQLGDRGVPLLEELTNITGKSSDELRKMAEKGQLSTGLVNKAFESMTGEGGKFYKMMELKSNTLGGLLSTMSDVLGGIGRKILGLSDTGEILEGGLLSKLKVGTKALIDFLNSPAFGTFAENAGRAIGFVADLVEKTLGEFINLGKILFTDEYPGLFGLSEDDPVILTIYDIKFALQDLIQNGVELAKSAFETILDLGKILFTDEYPGLFGLSEDDPIILTIYDIKFAIIDLVDNAVKVASQAFNDFVNQVWNPVLLPALQAIGKHFEELGKLILQDLVNFINNTVRPDFERFGKQIGEIAKYFSDRWKEIAPSIVPALEGFLKWIRENVYPTVKVIFEAVYTVISWLVGRWIENFRQMLDTTSWVIGKVKAFWDEYGSYISGVFEGIFRVIRGVADVIIGIFRGDKGRIESGFKGIFDGLVDIAWNAFSGVGKAIASAINTHVIPKFNKFATAFNVAANFLPGGAGGAKIPTLPYLAKGVDNFEGGLAYVHAGELLTYLPKGANVLNKTETKEVMKGQQGGDLVLNLSGFGLVNSRSIQELLLLIRAEAKRAGFILKDV